MADFFGGNKFTKKALLIAGLCFVAGAGLWYITEMNKKKELVSNSRTTIVQKPKHNASNYVNDENSVEDVNQINTSTTTNKQPERKIINEDNMVTSDEQPDKENLDKERRNSLAALSQSAFKKLLDSDNDSIQKQSKSLLQETEDDRKLVTKTGQSLNDDNGAQKETQQIEESPVIIQEQLKGSCSSKQTVANEMQVATSTSEAEVQKDPVKETTVKPKEKTNVKEAIAAKNISSVDTDFVVVDKVADENKEPMQIDNNDTDKATESENETVSVVMVEKESENKEDEARLKGLIQKYDQITEKVSKYKQFKYKNGKLKINLLRATNMEDKDKTLNKNNLSDVMITFDVTNQKHQKSIIVKDSENPVWNGEMFIFDVDDPLQDTLTAKVEDHDPLVNDEIGIVTIKIIDVVSAKDSCIKEGQFDVVGSKYGWLFLDLSYSEES